MGRLLGAREAGDSYAAGRGSHGEYGHSGSSRRAIDGIRTGRRAPGPSHHRPDRDQRDRRDRHERRVAPEALPATQQDRRQDQADQGLDREEDRPGIRRSRSSHGSSRALPNAIPSATNTAASSAAEIARGQPRPWRHIAPAAPSAGPAIAATRPQTVAAWAAPMGRIPSPRNRIRR